MLDDEKKRDLIIALAKSAVFQGWGDQSLAEAATQVDVDEAFALEFLPNETKRVLAHSDMADKEMIRWAEDGGLEACDGVRACLHALIMYRFKTFDGVKLAIQKGLQHLGQPSALAQTGKTTWETLDAMWKLTEDHLHQGKHPQGFDSLTKRGLLSAVYGTSLLAWFADQDKDLIQTDAFVRNRLNNVITVFGGLNDVKKRVRSVCTGQFA